MNKKLDIEEKRRNRRLSLNPIKRFLQLKEKPTRKPKEVKED